MSYPYAWKKPRIVVVLYSVELRNSSILVLLCTMLIGLPWNGIINAVPETRRTGVIDSALTGLQTSQSKNSNASIVENGGFEEGLRGWTANSSFIASPGVGFPSISTSSFHSGTAAVALNFLSSNAIGAGGQAMELTGIYQTLKVTRITGLHIHAWFSMRQTVSQVAARMRIQVGGLEVNYYVAYDSEQHIRYYDNPTSRSVFAYQIGPGQSSWWELDRNVDQDFGSLFGSEGQRAFQVDQTTVMISLELIGFGSILNYQTMYWDDVQGIATISTGSTTTTTSVSSTSITSSSTESTLAEPSTTRSSSSTSTSTRMGEPLSGAVTLVQVSVAVAIVLTLVICFYLAARNTRKRKPTGIMCGSCGVADLPTDSIYCPECGTKLNRPSQQDTSDLKPRR